MEDLFIWNEVQKLFETLIGGVTGGKNTEVLTLYQFQKLSKVPFGNPNVIKADNDILYKNAIRRAGLNSEGGTITQMDLYVFMDAIEVLSQKLFANKTSSAASEASSGLYEYLRQFLDYCNTHFENASAVGSTPSKKGVV